MIFFY